MAREFTLTPHEVPRVETGLRRIVTPLPAPASLDVLAALRRHEPRAMQGQPPIVWDRAEGFQVYDNSGNCWIDWSSGVLITNAGHGRREIRDAIAAHANSGLLATYAFANETRARLLSRLSGLLPPELNRIFLLTTGSETVECAIKLSRMHGLQSGGRGKKVIVSFQDAFHGRTLGAQQAGGIPDLKTWIGNLDAAFVQVPFPDGYRNTEVSFDAFLRRLQEQGVEANTIAGVVAEWSTQSRNCRVRASAGPSMTYVLRSDRLLHGGPLPRPHAAGPRLPRSGDELGRERLVDVSEPRGIETARLFHPVYRAEIGFVASGDRPFQHPRRRGADIGEGVHGAARDERQRAGADGFLLSRNRQTEAAFQDVEILLAVVVAMRRRPLAGLDLRDQRRERPAGGRGVEQHAHVDAEGADPFRLLGAGDPRRQRPRRGGGIGRAGGGSHRVSPWDPVPPGAAARCRRR